MESTIRHPMRGYILAATSVLVLPIGIFVPKGLAVLFVLASVLILMVMVSDGRRWYLPVNGSIKILAGLILFACLSSFWSMTPQDSIYKAVILAATVVGGIGLAISARSLTDTERDMFEAAMRWGGAFGFALLGEEVLGGAKVTLFLRDIFGKADVGQANVGNLLNLGITMASLYLWPWAALVWRKWPVILALPLVVAAASILHFSNADAPLFGLMAGLLAAVAVFTVPRVASIAIAAVLVMGVIGAPLLPNVILSGLDINVKPRFISDSGYHRLLIWETTANKIFARPVFGYGFDTSRAMYNKTQKVRTMRYDKDGKAWWGVTSEPIPLHPHNNILQVWLELGAGGALLLLALLLSIVKNIRTATISRLDRAVCFGFFISVVTVASISFGAWQGWWLATQWLTAAFIIATSMLPASRNVARAGMD